MFDAALATVIEQAGYGRLQQMTVARRPPAGPAQRREPGYFGDRRPEEALLDSRIKRSHLLDGEPRAGAQDQTCGSLPRLGCSIAHDEMSRECIVAVALLRNSVVEWGLIVFAFTVNAVTKVVVDIARYARISDIYCILFS